MNAKKKRPQCILDENFHLGEVAWAFVFLTAEYLVKRNMADEDDERAKNGHSEWKETCIGIWTRSTRKESVDGEERSKICNGISVVKLKKVPCKSRKCICLEYLSQAVRASVGLNRTSKTLDLTNCKLIRE